MTWWWSFVSKEITTRRKAAPKPTPRPTRCQGTFDFGAWTMWIWDQDGKDLADCPAMSFVSVCWHSRKWEPPIRGRLLQMLLPRLWKVNWTDFFCKIGTPYAWVGYKCTTQGKKMEKTTQKTRFFHLLQSSGWHHDDIRSRLKCCATNQAKLSQVVGRGRKNHFFGVVSPCFCPVSVHVCPTHAYAMPILQKKSVQLTFSSRRSSICKSPPRIGGSHFLLCQHTNTKDIAGQSAQARLTSRLSTQDQRSTFTECMCADSQPLPFYNKLLRAGRYLLAVFSNLDPIFLYWKKIIMN